jgi:hypothetical protein
MKTLSILAACAVAFATTAPTALAHGRTGGYAILADTPAPEKAHPDAGPFATDTLPPRGSQIRLASGIRSFSWPDAGIGAGVGISSILCLAGGTLLFARRHRKHGA